VARNPQNCGQPGDKLEPGAETLLRLFPIGGGLKTSGMWVPGGPEGPGVNRDLSASLWQEVRRPSRPGSKKKKGPVCKSKGR